MTSLWRRGAAISFLLGLGPGSKADLKQACATVAARLAVRGAPGSVAE